MAPRLKIGPIASTETPEGRSSPRNLGKLFRGELPSHFLLGLAKLDAGPHPAISSIALFLGEIGSGIRSSMGLRPPPNLPPVLR